MQAVQAHGQVPARGNQQPAARYLGGWRRPAKGPASVSSGAIGTWTLQHAMRIDRAACALCVDRVHSRFVQTYVNRGVKS